MSHKPGADHQNADALSRLPEVAETATTMTTAATRQVGAPCPAVEGSWADRQGQDPELAKIRQWRKDGSRPTWKERQSLPPAGRQLLGEWERLEVRDGVLVRRHPAREGPGEGVAVVAPAAEKRALWNQYHVALGHAKGSRLLMALRERLFWIGMSQDSHQWAQECRQCVLGRPEAGPRAPLCSIDTGYPWETLALDYLSLRRPGDSHQYILVIVDLFSRFAFAVPTTDQTAATTARVLWRTVFQPFGCPERILTDRGAAFEADLIQQFCDLYGCRKVRTTPYHPQGNGACEWMNQTILSLLNTLELREQPRWREHLPGLVHAYNNTPHSVTGYAPFFVVFGRNARLPVDQAVGLARPGQQVALQDWVRQHHDQLRDAYRVVKERTQQRQQQDQGRLNRGRRAQPLLPGERVLVRDFRRRSRGKLGYYWNPQPHVVQSQPMKDRPVYVIRPEGKDGPLRTMHQNNLCVQPSSWRSGARGDAGEWVDRPLGLQGAGGGPDKGWWPVGFPAEPGQQVAVEDPREVGEVGEAFHDAGEGDSTGGDAVVGSGPRRSQRANLGVRPARYQV